MGAEYSENSGYTQIIGMPVRGREGILFPSDNSRGRFSDDVDLDWRYESADRFTEYRLAIKIT